MRKQAAQAVVADRTESHPKGTGVQHVYGVLKEMILSLDLAPGAPLDEARLAKQLGLSRTPIREALIRLGSEKLVVQLSNRGAMVAALDLSDLRNYFEALDFAQRAVTRLAAERAQPEHMIAVRHHMLKFEAAAARRDSDTMMQSNRDFHVAIAAVAGNTFMHDMCVTLYNQGLRVSRMAVTYDFDRDHKLSDHLDLIIEQHREFVVLIEGRHADEAEKLGGVHAELARQRVVNAMAQIGKRPI